MTMQHKAANTGNQNRNFPDKCATYWWIMLMNPDQKVNELRGYGKIEGHNENRSKIQNLFRITNMLWERGYFQRTREITIYERRGPLCSIHTDVIRMIITPEQINYIPTGLSNEDIPMQQFLTNFKLCIHNNISPRIHLRPITK
jgi:hypothetical protein